MPSFPPRLAIAPLSRPPYAAIRPPASKSIANRALVLAALASRHADFTLTGMSPCGDVETMIACLSRLGFRLEPDWDKAEVRVRRHHGRRLIPAAWADLDCGDSGTTMRFLTAAAALGNGAYRLDGSPRLRQRPIAELLNALRGLGVRATCTQREGYPPVVIEGTGLSGGTVHVRGDRSSQFASGLLLAAVFADNESRVVLDGPSISLPYIRMTTDIILQFGGRVETMAEGDYRVFPAATTAVDRYAVEPDATSASYFFAAAAITGGKVMVRGLHPQSIQGDIRFLDLLAEMGCATRFEPEGAVVEGGPLRGIDVDLSDASDTFLTLASAACFASSPTRIRGIAHVRFKESDRLAAAAAELARVGAGVEQFEDGLAVHPAPLHAAEVETYNDHRIAMSMALIGLRVPGIVIQGPACVAKTYPEFFRDLELLRLEESAILPPHGLPLSPRGVGPG